MSELSRDEVVEILGPRLSDVVIAEIIATGITPEELKVARDQVVQARKTHTPGPDLKPGHIAKVIDIVARLHSGACVIDEGYGRYSACDNR